MDQNPNFITSTRSSDVSRCVHPIHDATRGVGLSQPMTKSDGSWGWGNQASFVRLTWHHLLMWWSFLKSVYKVIGRSVYLGRQKGCHLWTAPHWHPGSFTVFYAKINCLQVILLIPTQSHMKGFIMVGSILSQIQKWLNLQQENLEDGDQSPQLNGNCKENHKKIVPPGMLTIKF